MPAEETEDNSKELRWYASAPLWKGKSDNGAVQVHVTGRRVPPMWVDPYCFQADHLTVVFDGFLYDTTELMSVLGMAATDSKSNPAYLTAHAYRKWGDNFPAMLRGVFCILVTDFDRGLTLVVRDHAGIQPCFYAIVNDRLIVSPSLDGIRLAPGVSHTPNVEMMQAYLHGGSFLLKEETVIREVKRLLAGNVLNSSDGQPSAKRYWMAEVREEFSDCTADEIQEQFEQAFSKAVARCIGLAPPAVLLSGGLDSVSVAAFAKIHSQQYGTPAPIALSLIFPDEPSCNEEEIQRYVAKSLGLQQTCVDFGTAAGPEGCLARTLEITKQWPAPLDNFWYGAYQVLHRDAVAAGCGVILTGGGGDEWLTVTPRYATNLIREMRIVALYKFTVALIRFNRMPFIPMLRNVLWTNGVRPVLVNLLRRRAPTMYARIKRRRLERLKLPNWFPDAPGFRKTLLERALENSSALSNGYFHEMRMSLDHALVSMEKEELYLMGRACGVRILEPFWDSDLVELLFHVRPEYLLSGNRTKSLVRDLMHKRFPDAGFAVQRKIPATSFFRSLIADGAVRSMKALKDLSSLGRHGVVDQAAAEEFMKEAARNWSNDAISVFHVWTLLNFETWSRSDAKRWSYSTVTCDSSRSWRGEPRPKAERPQNR